MTWLDRYLQKWRIREARRELGCEQRGPRELDRLSLMSEVAVACA